MFRGTEFHTLAKSATFEFLEDDVSVCTRFLSDVECNYQADPIVYVLQAVSQIFLDIFCGIASSYIFYKLYAKIEEKKTRKKLEGKISRILEQYRADLDFRMGRLLDEYKQLQQRDRAHQAHRVELYIEKANLLRNPSDTTKVVINIIEDQFNVGLDEQEKRVRRFRLR